MALYEQGERLFGQGGFEDYSDDRRGSARPKLKDAISQQFFGVGHEDLTPGYQITTELMPADTIKLKAEGAKLDAKLRRRLIFRPDRRRL
jgi:hypothetical protein